MRKEASCTELLRKVLCHIPGRDPENKLEAAGLAGSSGRGRSHLVGMGFRHVPFRALRLPLLKLLTEVSWAPFPVGASQPPLTPSAGGTRPPELVGVGQAQPYPPQGVPLYWPYTLEPH